MDTVKPYGKEYVALHTDDVEEVDVDLDQAESDIKEPVSLQRIYFLSIASFGIGLAWSLEFAIATPFFEKTFKASKMLSHAIWIAGPVSGLIVAPIVGALSDRIGRREPFIVGGLLATISSMLCFSNVTAIASLFAAVDSEPHRKISLALAVLFFCIMDLAINTTMWPVRALQRQLAPKSQQHYVQSAVFVMMSLGDLTVNGIVHFFEKPIAHIRVIFLISAALYTVSTLTLLLAGPQKVNNVTTDTSSSHSFSDYFRGLPPELWRIGAPYALGFFTFYCFLPYASSWMGSSVLQGRAEAPPASKEALLYEKGVNLYGQAGIIRGIVQILFSAFYPKFLEWGASSGQLMCLGFMSFAIVTLIFAGTHSVLIGQLCVILYSLPYACLMTVPIGLALTLEQSDETNCGRILGLMNIFAVIPQLIDTAYTGVLSAHFGEAAVIRAGAAWSLLTAISAILFMRNVG